MRWLNTEYYRVAEYLDNKLGRHATDAEIERYIKDIEDRTYDSMEAELKGN